MRILVHGGSVRGRAERMTLAAAGLCLRGHEVLWAGGGAPGVAGCRAVGAGIAPARHHVDVVLGGPRPVSAAVAGWMARARCLVLALDGAALRRWGPAAQLAWGSLHAWGIVEEAEAPLVRAAGGVDGERMALWPPGPPPGSADASHPDTEARERLCERALARQRGGAVRAAVFLDRDGTIVVERGYLSGAEEIELLPGAAEGLQELQAAFAPPRRRATRRRPAAKRAASPRRAKPKAAAATPTVETRPTVSEAPPPAPAKGRRRPRVKAEA